MPLSRRHDTTLQLTSVSALHRRCASTFCASTLLDSVGSLSMWSALRPLAPRLGAHRAVWLVATIHPAAVRAKRARVRRCTSLPCASPVCASPFLGSVGSLPMQSARRPLAPRLSARDITLVATRRCAFSQHARRCRTLCASPLCASTLCVSSPSCRSCCLHILASRALLLRCTSSAARSGDPTGDVASPAIIAAACHCSSPLSANHLLSPLCRERPVDCASDGMFAKTLEG